FAEATLQLTNAFVGLPNDILPGSIRANNYGLSPAPLHPTWIDGADESINPAGLSSPANYERTYAINPQTMGLAVKGNYKIVSLLVTAQYEYSRNPADAVPIYTTGTETSENTVNNITYATFSVVPQGFGTLPSSDKDIYKITNIVLNPNPPIAGQANVAEVTVEYTAPSFVIANPSTTLGIIIRDSKGNQIFSGNQPVTFVSMGGQTQTMSVALNDSDIVSGQSFTIYANVPAYNDADNAKDEKVTGNNSSFRTFSVIEAQQTISVPDAPWWMSLLVFSVVLGWMILSRNEEKKFLKK
ncbi:MAG: hypothetical protein AABY11_03020, partial [archaeon]